MTMSSRATDQFDQPISLCFVTNRSIARLHPMYHNVTREYSYVCECGMMVLLRNYRTTENCMSATSLIRLVPLRNIFFFCFSNTRTRSVQTSRLRSVNRYMLCVYARTEIVTRNVSD
jgi:hypothetical protein